jgi:hypothetical protein
MRGVIAASGWQSPTVYYVDLKLTNTGSDTAYNTTVTGLNIRSLDGHTVVAAGALPLAYGDVASGNSATKRIYFTVTQTPSRFSATASVTMQNSAVAKLNTSWSSVLIAN